MRFLIALTLAVLIACGGSPPTVPPIPTPTPTVAPTPPPQGQLTTLHPTSGGWVDDSGKRVVLKGVSYVPPDAKIYGWPSWISEDQLDVISRNGGNFVAVRLGPFSADGEGGAWVAYATGNGGLVNLDKWNDAFWNEVAAFVRAANQRGIYVEFDLVDSWVLKHGLSPWAASRNSNGYEGGSCGVIGVPGVDRRQGDWLNKIGEELAIYPNTLFQISNESDVCQGQLNPEWEKAVYRHFKSNLRWRGIDRPVGTNSDNADVEAYVDYVEHHTCSAPRGGSKPMGVNEWNCTLSPADFCAKVKSTPESGWFLLWGDGMSRGDWEEALKCFGS